MTSSRRAALIAILCLIWGSTWLAIKIGLEALPPFLGASARFGLAAIVLFALGRVRRVPAPRTARTHAGLFGLGLTTFAFSYGVVYWGEQYISSGLTAVLFSTHPLLVMLLAHVALPAERLTSRRALGVLLGLGGVMLIFRADLQFEEPGSVFAALVTLLSAVAAAVSNVAIKKWGTHLHPYTLTTLPMAYGATMLFAVSGATEGGMPVVWNGVAVATVLYLAIVGSVAGFVIYYTLLRVVRVSSLALVSYAFPVVAVALGYLVLGEPIEAEVVGGAVIIAAGIALATGAWRRSSTTRALEARREARSSAGS